MKHHDDEQLQKELEWDRIDATNSVNFGGIDFDAQVEWRKDIELNANGENFSEVHFENFFPCTKYMLNSLMIVILLEDHVKEKLKKTK